jgi:hypothetical protein
LKDKPEVSEALKFVLDYEVDFESDMMNGYPSTVCRKCSAAILNFADYKRLFQVSISTLFYEQLFCTTDFCAAFMRLQFGFVIFWRKDFGAKAAH